MKKELVNDPDARRWAREFNEALVANGHQPFMEDWLTTWFASAIMCGYDYAKSEGKDDV